MMKNYFILAFFLIPLFVQSQNVGIGTRTPTAKLHVVGDTKITSLPNNVNTSSPVFWNPTTFVLESYPTSKKPFNTITYKITLRNSDWITDFDTKIPNTNYTMIVTGYSFMPLNLTNTGISHTNYSAGSHNPVAIVNAYIPSSPATQTWRLSADYHDANPLGYLPVGGVADYQWTITVLVIDNSFQKDLGIITSNIGLSASGAVAAPPTF